MEWEESRRALIGRVAGGLLLAGTAVGFIDPADSSSKLFASLSSQQIVDWAAHHGTGISVNAFAGAVQNSLIAVSVVLLVGLLRGHGIIAAVAYVSAAAFMAIGWVKAGVTWALADLAGQGGNDSGVVALFKLVKAMTFTDGFCFAMALTCLGGLVLLTGLLPAAIAWLSAAVAAVHFLAIPAQLLLTGSVAGVTGPISVVFALLWVVALGLLLLIRPVWRKPAG